MSRTIFIVAADGATGGVELLHQLADSLTRAGVAAKMLYHPFSRKVRTPAAYEKYQVVQGHVDEVGADSIVVLPEVYSPLVRRFRGSEVHMWWLSVDNYRGSGNLRYLIRNGFWPLDYIDLKRRRFPANVTRHLVQSEYARRFLQSHGVPEADWLSDYINPAFAAGAATAAMGAKRDIVAYNPAKGREMTEQVMQAVGRDRFVALAGMTREEVVATLSCAKAYIDFGNHPGKDRIPREAAALGCCVITNRRGSAGNLVDVPIDEAYKIADDAPDFAQRTAGLIEAIFQDYDAHAARFEPYRRFIASEQDAFERDARTIFAAP